MTPCAVQTTPTRNAMHIVLRIFLIACITTESAMANPKSEHITLDLSGTRISYASPVNYSKDYPRAAETQYRINIHDQDLYIKHNKDTKSKNLHAIRKSEWDYGRSLIWRSVVKGTLSMTVALYRPQHELDPQDPEAFIKAVQADFEQLYNKQARKKFRVIAPENYQIKTLSGIPWRYYEYSIGGERIKRLVVYAYPLSDQHYLRVQFNFTSHSEDQKDKWEQQAQQTVDFIMASFEVK